MVRKLFISLVLLVAICCIAVAGGWYWLNTWANSPVIAANQTLIVERGSNLTSVSRQIFSDQSPLYFRSSILYARLQNQTAIQSGEYQLDADDSWQAILDLLESGNTVKRQVTLVEGWTVKQALEHLHSQEKIERTLSSVSDESLIAILPEGYKHPEGWFFADTYQYQLGDSDLDILKRSHQKMRDVLGTGWQERDQNIPLQSAYEALVLASIVEKETGLDSERPVIASVFTQRLRKRMRLQTDPTVIYGLGDSYKGNITRKHLRQKTDYNTYVIKGLPPTPIALVGAEAIQATLHPAAEEYLYFVAKGDGSHYFSKTLDEHNKAVREYQLVNRAKEYRSQPLNQ